MTTVLHKTDEEPTTSFAIETPAKEAQATTLPHTANGLRGNSFRTLEDVLLSFAHHKHHAEGSPSKDDDVGPTLRQLVAW